jgi:hypothetical protein
MASEPEPGSGISGPWRLVERVGVALELGVAALLQPVGELAYRLGQFLLDRLPVLRRFIPPSTASTTTPEDQPPPAEGDAPAEGTMEEPEAPARPRGIAWWAAVGYLLVVGAWAVLTIMRRVDSALQQMALGGRSAGSALGFPVSFSHVAASLRVGTSQAAVDATRKAWAEYASEVARATTVFRSPFQIGHTLVLLDVCFMALYAALTVLGLVALGRLNAQAAGDRPDERQRRRRARLLYGAGGALFLLLVVDALEDVELQRALVAGHRLWSLSPAVALGPLMSLLKVPLTVAVLIPVLFVAISLAAESRPLGSAFMTVRGILYAVAALVLLLMVGIGAGQLDDVIRAWDGWRAVWAVLACLALSVTVAGIARRLSSTDREHLDPDEGRSSQPLLLGGGVLLVVAGLLVRVAGLGWGLSVAGGLLIVLWALGLPLVGLPHQLPLPVPLRRGPRWLVVSLVGAAGAVLGAVLARLVGLPFVPGVLVGGLAALAVLGAWSSRAAGGDTGRTPQHRPPQADRPVDPSAVALWGDRLGRVAGSAVAAAVVVAIARATALDAYLRADLSGEVLRWPLVGAVGAGLSGLVVCAYRAQRVGGAALVAWTTAWGVLTLAALVVGVMFLQDRYAVTGPQAGGSVAVVLGGFLLLSGVLALLAGGLRKGAVTKFALAPTLRTLRFKRFPVLLFLLVWALAVSALDTGGYHDIRRTQLQAADTVAPTIGQAWQQYVRAVPGGTVRPVVVVGAQGGGIRAAVWTALVMECLFGPGPVAGSGDLCAEGDGQPDPQRLAAAVHDPLPVFLASGASGGSVGLAAWSARRADLVQDGPASTTPRTVESALDRDFVAPDVARLILGDLPHALLAWDLPDRAELLERAWEGAWYDNRAPGPSRPARGLTRGLRQTWDLTHANGVWATPVLALNGISVEDDCRFLASAVDFTLPRQLPEDPTGVATAVQSTDDRPDDAACRGVPSGTGRAVDILPSTNELIDYLCPTEDVPLSTAAHISARFPYVSPTGRVQRRGCPNTPGLVLAPAISYDADGGLFDNSGSGTAVDTWRALAPLAAATERATGTCLVPIFVQVDNSTGRATISTHPDPRPSELTAPVSATLGQVSSRETYARSGAAAAFGRLVSADGRRVTVSGPTDGDPLWFRIMLFGQPGPEPPLGWTLAPETVNLMRSQLRAVPNQEQIGALRHVLEPGGLTCEEQ